MRRTIHIPEMRKSGGNERDLFPLFRELLGIMLGDHCC